MRSVRSCRWAMVGAMIAGAAGCHSATPQEQMQAAQNSLMGKLMALQKCETGNGYSSPQCGDQRDAYEKALAAFRAKYAR